MSMKSGEAIEAYSLERIREARKIPIDVVKDKEALSDFFPETVLEHVRRTDRGQVSLSRLAIIQMDEYLTRDGLERMTMNNPFSFAVFVWNNFASEAIAKCGFKKENWIVPDPHDSRAVERAIRNWGGVDIAFAGIGLNGHLAFNEPTTSRIYG